MDTGKIIQDLKRFAAFCEEWHKPEVSIQYIAYHTDDLTHRKRGKDRSDSKTFDVTEEDTCHTGSCEQTDNIKRDLNNRIFLLYNLWRDCL